MTSTGATAPSPKRRPEKNRNPNPAIHARIPDDAALFALLKTNVPALQPIRRAAAEGQIDKARTLFASYLATRKSPKYFFSPDDGPALIKAFEQTSPAYVRRQIREADLFMARNITIEGDHRQLTKIIQWHQGPLEWTNVLSRFEYWESELVAWWKTGDAKYAEDFVDVMRQWIQANPAPEHIHNSFGKNGNVWRTLEMGIRGDAWIRAFYGFQNAPCFTPADKTMMVRSLVEHARLLYAYNKNRGYAPGNWQVVEATGLLCIAIEFPEFTESDAWREEALSILETQLDKGVFPDGAYMECTPGYHNWVAERLMTAARLCDLNGIATPILGEKYRKMYTFDLAIAMPDRTAPMVGDCGRSSLEGPLANGALLFHDSKLRFFASPNLTPEAIWLFGTHAIERYQSIAPKKPDFISVCLPDSGFIVMRSGWNPSARYLFFNAVRYGGAHSHSDALDVDVYADRLLVTDSGRENYNNPLHRNYFRKTRAHNVVMIGGREQPREINPKVNQWITCPAYDYADASVIYDGFTHRRRVVFVKPDYWILQDIIDGSGEQDLEQLWNFVPTTLRIDGPSIVRSDDKDKTNLFIVQALTDGLRTTVEPGWYGPAAGASTPAPTAVFKKHTRLPAMFLTVLYPSHNGVPPKVSVETLPINKAPKARRAAPAQTSPASESIDLAKRDLLIHVNSDRITLRAPRHSTSPSSAAGPSPVEIQRDASQ